jgi:Tfp pilus assembly protein PilZ
MSDRTGRQFIRHPTEIPVEVHPVDSTGVPHRARNLSHGGLSFHANQEMTLGSVVNLRITSVEPAFESAARVVWCRPVVTGFDLGVAFLNAEDAYRARMVEQICHIESYRRKLIANEGRTLTPEAAAREWIARFSDSFPDPDVH